MIDPLLLEARAAFYDRAWPSREYVDYVRSNSIGPELIAGYAGATGVLPVYDCGAGRFDFDPHLHAPADPIDCFVCEALDADGETSIDLVAWPLDHPHHVLSMFGRAPILGMWEALNPATYYMGKSLAMHRTPVDWLSAGCSGAAIVNPQLAAYLFLKIPGDIAARDQAHARDLLRIARSVVNERRFRVAVGTNQAAA
ncbi:MAG: hypothetical protein JWQ89_3379 [Devosia sp.]|uniref:hypothetical protein n=1 Tax=Devosia sp. TaxID=1871048 RepID=UPI002610B17A|nr:hypothetical protein [Devosia sp.]MDB5541652.1 hypothetical protein [Devosia sp.]